MNTALVYKRRAISPRRRGAYELNSISASVMRFRVRRGVCTYIVRRKRRRPYLHVQFASDAIYRKRTRSDSLLSYLIDMCVRCVSILYIRTLARFNLALQCSLRMLVVFRKTIVNSIVNLIAFPGCAPICVALCFFFPTRLLHVRVHFPRWIFAFLHRCSTVYVL